MEVHHHPHPGKKKFKEYFLEFLMIFLAVTLGFFAENIREHFVESARAKQYAGLLIADLKRDTAWFNTENKRWRQKEKDLDTLVKLLIQPKAASDKCVLEKLFHINYVSDAKINTATYNQMKTSGSLRYINDLTLVTKVEEYYETELPRVIESSRSTINFFNEYVKTFFIDHLRNQDMKNDSISMSNYTPIISGRTKESDQRLSNIIDMDRTQQKIANDFYNSANKTAGELVVFIEKKYDLKDD